MAFGLPYASVKQMHADMTFGLPRACVNQTHGDITIGLPHALVNAMQNNNASRPSVKRVRDGNWDGQSEEEADDTTDIKAKKLVARRKGKVARSTLMKEPRLSIRDWKAMVGPHTVAIISMLSDLLRDYDLSHFHLNLSDLDIINMGARARADYMALNPNVPVPACTSIVSHC
jgi:hypothetical protein